MNKRNTVGSLVQKDLNLKLEQGQTVAQIKAMSQSDINTYESYFRTAYAHQLSYSFKDGTVNRYVEKWIKANTTV